MTGVQTCALPISLAVCTVTALVILVSGLPLSPAGLTGAPLTAAAYGCALGRAGGRIVTLSLLLFAFSSILGWSYYGEQCLSFLLGDRSKRLLVLLFTLYRAVFLGCTILGAVWSPHMVWQLVDLCNALMALPNLTALLLLAPNALFILRSWKGSSKKAHRK